MQIQTGSILWLLNSVVFSDVVFMLISMFCIYKLIELSENSKVFSARFFAVMGLGFLILFAFSFGRTIENVFLILFGK